MNDEQLTPVGYLDRISDEGWVIGWAWYPDAPERRVDVNVIADDKIIGTATANLNREDVAAAGFGDGRYGFSIALPYQVLSSARPTVISIHDRVSGAALAKPIVFSQPALREASAQLDGLNQDVRLLSAALTKLQTKEAADNHATATLFQIVADFFSQLADATRRGESPKTLRTLSSAVAETTQNYPQLDFTPSNTPAISVCFLASGDMDAMYTSLASLQSGFANANAELLIMDAEDSVDAPLLPLLARHARYARGAGNTAPAMLMNELAEAAHGALLCFITAPVVLKTPWLADLPLAFAQPDLSILSVQIVGEDGIVEHAGALVRNGQLCERGSRTPTNLASPEPVDASAGQIFVVRRESWQALGGFDPHFETIDGAVAALCLRARAAGLTVLYDHRYEAVIAPSPAPPPDNLARTSADTARLQSMYLAYVKN